MSYKPVICGGVVVEVPKDEYEELVRNSEKIDTIKRFITANTYVAAKDIAILLGIENEEKKGNIENEAV